MKELVLVSGGVYSAVLLADAVRRSSASEVGVVHFRRSGVVGDRLHTAATAVCSALGVADQLVFDGSFLIPGSLSNYRGVHKSAGGVESPHTLGQTLTVMAAAAGLAEAKHIPVVTMGLNKADWDTIPECRPESVYAAIRAVSLYSHLSVYLPFFFMRPRDILRLGDLISAPVQLGYSCFTGADTPCGVCAGCAELVEARKKIPR